MIISESTCINVQTVPSLQDWRSVQVLIGKTGKESLKRRIKELQFNKVDLQNAATARMVLLQYTKEQVQNVSVGVATFYIWVRTNRAWK